MNIFKSLDSLTPVVAVLKFMSFSLLSASIFLISACYSGDTDRVAKLIHARNLGITALAIEKHHEDKLREGRTVQLSAKAEVTGQTDLVSLGVSEVTWGSTDTIIASVDESGLVTANSVGITTIHMLYAELTAEVTVEVSDAPLQSLSILVEGNNVDTFDINECGQAAIKVEGNYGADDIRDESPYISWDPELALQTNVKISNYYLMNSKGSTSAVVLNALLDDQIDSITVNVLDNLSSITISGLNSSISYGTQTTLNALATYDDSSTNDITERVNWILDPASTLASISNSVLTAGVDNNVGSFQLTSTCAEVVSNAINSSVVTDVSAITISGQEQISLGGKIQLVVIVLDSDGVELEDVLIEDITFTSTVGSSYVNIDAYGLVTLERSLPEGVSSFIIYAEYRGFDNQNDSNNFEIQFLES